MLWVDKHRPRSLQETNLHEDVNGVLRKLAATKDFPHLLVSGPSGSGKKTRVHALLRGHFGDSVLNMRLEHKPVRVTDSKTIDVATLSSPHHIEINPADAGSYDRVIVMTMIREIAENAPMVTSSSSPRFKVVVLNEVDKLTRAAQQALRRTMEKYMATCRLILMCSSTSRLIPPLRSRCLGIRVPGHTLDDTKKAVEDVCTKEGIPAPSDRFINTLHHRSDGNLRRGLLMLEAGKMAKCDFAGNGLDLPIPDWKTYVGEVAQDILTEQTPKRLYDIRLKYYELLGHCIPGEVILKEVVAALLDAVGPQMRNEVVMHAAKYDHSMKLGSKPIMHLEAFTAQIMKSYKALSSR